MGGRGSSSSISKLGDFKKIFTKGEPQEIYLSRAMERGNAVLIAERDVDGTVWLRPANDEDDKVEGKPAGTVRVQHGIIKGKPINLDLTKAKAVYGTTFEYRETIKSAGFQWSKYKRRYYNKRLPSKEIDKYYPPDWN